jgi:hypothetical protein
VDALPQAPSAWDASAFVRRDAAADAVLRELRQPLVDDAEKLVGPARADPALGASRRRLGLRAAPAVALIAPEPCKPGAARFAGRSCEALEAPERAGALQRAALAERSRKPLEALRLRGSVSQAMTRAVEEACSPATVP